MIFLMCAKHGVDYVDGGEPVGCLKCKHLVTKESGARIVHSCGFDSIPSDLGVFMLLQTKIGKPVEQVNAELDP